VTRRNDGSVALLDRLPPRAGGLMAYRYSLTAAFRLSATRASPPGKGHLPDCR